MARAIAIQRGTMNTGQTLYSCPKPELWSAVNP